jgi:hypothetical protein
MRRKIHWVEKIAPAPSTFLVFQKLAEKNNPTSKDALKAFSIP